MQVPYLRRLVSDKEEGLELLPQTSVSVTDSGIISGIILGLEPG